MAEKKVPYQVNGRQFEGVIVYDDGVKEKRPLIFMQPDWKGVCADTMGQARTVAGKDYVVLMADMFGAGYGDKPKTQAELAAGMRAVHTSGGSVRWVSTSMTAPRANSSVVIVILLQGGPGADDPGGRQPLRRHTGHRHLRQRRRRGSGLHLRTDQQGGCRHQALPGARL